MGFRELARWRIFSESLANGLWRNDTLANLWSIFGECLANGIWELTRWRSFGHYLANLWRMFCEWLLGN